MKLPEPGSVTVPDSVGEASTWLVSVGSVAVPLTVNDDAEALVADTAAADTVPLAVTLEQEIAEPVMLPRVAFPLPSIDFEPGNVVVPVSAALLSVGDVSA